MLAAGLLLSGFQNLAMDIAVERSEGTLKRLGGTPLLARVVLHRQDRPGHASPGRCRPRSCSSSPSSRSSAELPTDPAKWAVFAWVFMLGITGSALLGVASVVGAAHRQERDAVVVPIALVLQFISGVYLFFYQLPRAAERREPLPAQVDGAGMRYVFLPDDYAVARAEPGMEPPGVAIALAIWLVVGLALSRLTFRWIRRDA